MADILKICSSSVVLSGILLISVGCGNNHKSAMETGISYSSSSVSVMTQSSSSEVIPSNTVSSIGLGATPSSSSQSSVNIINYDMACPSGFDLTVPSQATGSYFCVIDVEYTNGYAPEPEGTRCAGGLTGSGDSCFMPRHACSWGIDTEVCKTSCAQNPDSSLLDKFYCGQLAVSVPNASPNPDPINYDIECKTGFIASLLPNKAGSIFCVSTSQYTDGYTPEPLGSDCAGGILSYGAVCFMPIHPCSWGLDTNVCKTACTEDSDSTTLIESYCSQVDQSSSSSSSSSPTECGIGKIWNGGECVYLDTCEHIAPWACSSSSSTISSSVSSSTYNVTDNLGCSGLENLAAYFDYYSVELRDISTTNEGTLKGLWKAHFNNGNVTLYEGDANYAGSYNCRDNKIIVTYLVDGLTEERFFDVNSDNAAFIEQTLASGEVVTYNALTRYEGPTTNCKNVQGRSYSNQEGLRTTFGTYPNTASYIGYSGIEHSGYYTCDSGDLAIYFEGELELGLSNPLYVDVADNGTKVRTGGRLFQEEEPIVCTADYSPVCGLIETQVQCVTAPCPALLTHKTFSNSCIAFADHAEIIAEGICGELESQTKN